MKLCCPRCGLHGPFESFSNDKDARHVAALMGRVPPPLAGGLLRYLGMFAPAMHSTPFAKTRRLLEELVPMIEAGRIQRSKRDWPVSLAQWEDGFSHMAERSAQLTLPLRSHGYLLEVLAGAVDKVEAKAESESITRAGSHGRKTADEPWPLGTAPALALASDKYASSRCRHELKQLLAANQRLGLTASHDALRKHLAGMGFGAAAIDHALKQAAPEQA